MSTSSGWLIANTTVLANASAPMASSRTAAIPAAVSGSVMVCVSWVATAPGDRMVVRMLYGLTS